MYPCFETIRWLDGNAENLYFHQNRVDKTRSYFGITKKFDLKEYLGGLPNKGLYRLRIEYDENFLKRTCTPYVQRDFKKFQIIQSDISYDYKYSDRKSLEVLNNNDYDDVIIAKGDELTDTTIANIALQIDGEWITPKNPLLAGTMRAKLLEEKKIKEDFLYIKDIKNAQKFAIMNALLRWKVIDNFEIRIDS